MTDYSTTTANLPSAAIRNPGWSEAYDDATNRDSATPTEYAGAHINAIHNEVEAIEKWLFRVATELTIDGAGAITVTHGHHTVDTAGDAGTDNLDTLDGGAAGKRVRLRAAHADRTVVIRDGQDNIYCGGSNQTLDDTNKWIEFEYDVPLSAWIIAGGGGGALTPWTGTIDAADNALEDLGRLNYTAASELTISTGAITATETVHTVDTEGDAATDDLDTINGGTEGDVLILLPAHADRTTWITDADNIDTPKDRHYPIPAVGARLYFHGSTWLLQSCGDWALVEDHTVALDNSMSAADINAAIAAMPRNVDIYNLLFQCADLTYTLNAEILLKGFYGWGTVDFQGNDGESGLHTNQAVILDFDASDISGVTFEWCNCRCHFHNLRVEYSTSTAARRGLTINGGLLAVVDGCYLKATDTTRGTGISVGFVPGNLAANYVDNMQYGIWDIQGRGFSSGNDDTGTPPLYGLRATQAGTIGKTGTQPAGSTANELTSGGGVIR